MKAIVQRVTTAKVTGKVGISAIASVIAVPAATSRVRDTLCLASQSEQSSSVKSVEASVSCWGSAGTTRRERQSGCESHITQP